MNNRFQNSQGSWASRGRTNHPSHYSQSQNQLQSEHPPRSRHQQQCAPPSQSNYEQQSEYQPRPERQQQSEYPSPPQHHLLPEQQLPLGYINSGEMIPDSFGPDGGADLFRLTFTASPGMIWTGEDEENQAEKDRDEVPNLRRHTCKYNPSHPRASDKRRTATSSRLATSKPAEGYHSSKSEWVLKQAGSSNRAPRTKNPSAPAYIQQDFTRSEAFSGSFRGQEMYDVEAYRQGANPPYLQNAAQAEGVSGNFQGRQVYDQHGYSQGAYNNEPYAQATPHNIAPYSYAPHPNAPHIQTPYYPSPYHQESHTQEGSYGSTSLMDPRTSNGYVSHIPQSDSLLILLSILTSSNIAIPSQDVRRDMNDYNYPVVAHGRGSNSLPRRFPGGPATGRVVKNSSSGPTSTSMTDRNNSISQYMGRNPMESGGMNDGYGPEVSAMNRQYGQYAGSSSNAMVVRQSSSSSSCLGRPNSGFGTSRPSTFLPSRMKKESQGLIGAPRIPRSNYLGDPNSKSYKMQEADRKSNFCP
jgi:hypothetical protein